MKKNDIQLSQLVNHQNPYAVFEEIKNNFINHYYISDFLSLRVIFKDFIDLMEGKFPGYRKCNTKFHDIQHTTDVLLAVSRLIDGYNIKHYRIPVYKVKLTFIAALFHDSGFVQTIDDSEGTGAKYTLNHVERSINFVSKYFIDRNFKKDDFEFVKTLILCTGPGEISNIKFKDKQHELLGMIIATANFLGQMSSRTYLEKLIFLYFEFKEAKINTYSSQLDLLKRTIEFYRIVKDLFEQEYRGVYNYAKFHFEKRYKIKKNLYIETIEKQIKYIQKIKTQNDIELKLRRKI